MALPKSFEDSPVSDEELKWVEVNFEDLRAKYGGQWIAVIGNQVVAHGLKLKDVSDQVDAKELENAFLKWIPMLGEEPPVLIL